MQKGEEGSHEEVDYSYSLVHKDQDVVKEGDSIAVFRENNLQGDQIFLAYFQKVNGEWHWMHTRGAEWDTPVKWSAMHEVPYFYSGAISDNRITEIYVGREKARIIEVEGNKRFWYVNSPAKEAEVKYFKEDGAEEIVEEVDEEMLEGWGR